MFYVNKSDGITLKLHNIDRTGDLEGQSQKLSREAVVNAYLDFLSNEVK